ncbi:hypothetical protein ES705_22221 [subsurface metagenome]
MSISLQLSYDQIKNLIDQLNMEEKERLAEYLDDQTLKRRFNKFLDSKKDIPVTPDEIAIEVEEVRQERYR